MNLRIFTILLFLISNNINTFSQNFPDSYFESSTGKLEYGFYVPENYDSKKSYPLVMYLHGWSNNYSVYLNWYNSEFQKNNPCFVFTPKTPTNWADWSGWSDKLTEPANVAMHVLDSLTATYSIDTCRLYVYGISMGGEGTFDLLDKFPNKFAAAMSVCGGGKPEWAGNISNTPIWMFHGSADDVNPPKLTEDVYDELVKKGAQKARYKNYRGAGHDIWDDAENEPAWNDWMFAHSNCGLETGAPSGKIKLEILKTENGNIQLLWNDIRIPEKKSEKIWYYKIFNSSGLVGTTEFDKTTFNVKAAILKDSYYVVAVNYNFGESQKSNVVFSKN